MALTQLLGFALKVLGDGTDRTVNVVAGNAPMGIVVPEAIGGHYEITPAFGLASLIPTGIRDVVSANGRAVTAVVSMGVITFTYGVGDMPAADEEDILYGNFTF